MQISRYWRLYAQMLRFEGARHQDGSVSLQNNPFFMEREARRRGEELKIKSMMREVHGFRTKEG